jgi:hypothetical protein
MQDHQAFQDISPPACFPVDPVMFSCGGGLFYLMLSYADRSPAKASPHRQINQLSEFYNGRKKSLPPARERSPLAGFQARQGLRPR